MNADLTKLTERELLGLLEWIGRKTDGEGMSYMRCCPVCLNECDHTPDCWLGNHLHPRPAEGSAEWADAEARKTQGDDTRGVRLAFWPPHQFAFINAAGKWRYRNGGSKARWYVGVLPGNRATWELYAPPKPEPPKSVRWKLGWKDGALRTVRRGIPADVLVCREWRGYRFNAWVYRMPDGEVLVLAGRYMPLYWSDRGGAWDYGPLNQEDTRRIWPEAVEMIRVKDAENG